MIQKNRERNDRTKTEHLAFSWDGRVLEMKPPPKKKGNEMMEPKKRNYELGWESFRNKIEKRIIQPKEKN